MVRYVVALGVMLGLNTLLFGIFERGLGIQYQVITTILPVPPGYLLYREWVFR